MDAPTATTNTDSNNLLDMGLDMMGGNTSVPANTNDLLGGGPLIGGMTDSN